MVTGIIGRKVGMTQVFETDGTVVPATIIKAGPCVVVQAKTVETDGYEAVQLGLVDEPPARVPGRHQTPSFRRRRGDARIDVPPRTGIDRRLVVSVACRERHARG